MERLFLKDGYIDFSGKEIKSRYGLFPTGGVEVLPYTVGQVETAGFPERFDTIIGNIIPNKETRMTLLYFLSLIPSGNTKYKYSALFLGEACTGKTVVCNAIRQVFFDTVSTLPIDAFHHPSPFIYYEMENKNAAILDDMDYKNPVNSMLYKNLTGGNVVAYRPIWGQTIREFTPTAQIIMVSNHKIKFSAKDAAIKNRLIVIPFKNSFINNPGRVSQESIDAVISREGASIIRHLIELYISLRDNLHGSIPVSAECKDAGKIIMPEEN